MLDNIHKLPEREKAELLALINETARREARSAAQTTFLDFIKEMWPGFIMGRHHKIMAEKFEAVARGDIKRLAISLPPRHSKSEMASYLLPAWYLGKYPDRQVMEASHTAELSVGFGRKVRNLIDTPAYQEIFPGVSLQQDSKSAGRWGTNKGGVYNALGVGGSAAGKGANLFVIDDPFSEQDIITGNSAATFDSVWEWYMSGPRQRLQPGGGIIVVHTRWGKRDLIGRLLDYAAKNPGADQWEYIEFPAIMPSGKSLWPEYWPIEELEKIKATIAPHLWNAQYMQNPTGEEGALLKRDWWQDWTKEDPPQCDYIIMSLDAAQEAHNRADYNAVTIWGVFERENENGDKINNVILLEAWRERMEFPELKRAMFKMYKEWEPDTFIVEKKSNGAALYQEMRAAGIPVTEFTPSKGNDKISRVNAVSDMFSSGLVWASKDRRWVQEVIDECAEFPNGDHDDYCFVAGTYIAMADGTQKKIEDILVGDSVATPKGSQLVEAAFCSGEKEIWRLSAGDTELLGTRGHRVHSDVGWVAIDSITQAQYITVLHPKGVLPCAKRPLYLMGTDLTDTLSPPTEPTECILGGRDNYCIESYGSTITEPSSQGIIYTIKMGALQTMRLVISSAYWLKHIGMRISKTKFNKGAPHYSSHIWIESDLNQSHGTVHQREKNGIDSMHMSRYTSRIASHMCAWLSTLKHVFGAVRRLQQKASELNSAQSSAAVRSLGSVAGSISTNTHTTAAVYNLTVAVEHCYFANSVLVHNCDSVTQALIRVRKGGFLRLPMDEEDDPREFRSIKRAGYY